MTHSASRSPAPPSAHRLRPALRIAGVVALAAALGTAGCNRSGASKAAAPSGPVEVGVVTLEPTAVTLTRELPGRTSAYRVAEVRARVNGIVLRSDSSSRAAT